MTLKTIAELKAEKAQIQVVLARRELSDALKASRPAADLQSSAAILRSMLIGELREIPGKLVRAIDAKREENDVHYHLSDAIHTLLQRIGQRAAEACGAIPELGASFRKGCLPRILMTVSEHADKQRWLGSGTNAPGQWRTGLTPYLRDIQDDLSEHSPVRTVVFCKSAGVGGTEAMFNWIHYTMQHLGNRDMMVVVPSLELRDRSFNPRLSKMIDENAGLRELVSRASRSSANRADILEYGANVRLIKAGANSADSLRSDHLPYVICDEVDAYKWDVGGEGDPMTLIENRQRTFSRAKTFLISTPTNEGESRIYQAYLRSDRRRYQVPCPHCQVRQPLIFEQLRYQTEVSDRQEVGETEQKIVTAAWYVCAECGKDILEPSKTGMLSKGRWIAERPHVKLTRGYHINALYAPVGLGLTWKQVAQKWVDVQGDTAGLKAFVNTYLGEVWREEGDGADANSLLSRVETYTLDTLIADRCILRITAGVDVQKDRIELSIVAWGAKEEAWLIDHLVIPGDTAHPEVWEELGLVLRDSRAIKVCVDAGYNTSMVMSFVEGKTWALPTKGIPGMGRPLIEDERKRRMRLRVRRKRGQPVEPLGVDQGKSMIYARLKLPKPGPGYVHFPSSPSFDDEYFNQLAAEHFVQTRRGSKVFGEWKKLRPRNEALDCFLLALAACRLAGDLPAQPLAPASREIAATAPKKPATPMVRKKIPTTIGW